MASTYVNWIVNDNLFLIFFSGVSSRKSISPNLRVSNMWTRCSCRKKTTCDTRRTAAITPHPIICSITITKPTVPVQRLSTRPRTTSGRRLGDGSAYHSDKYTHPPYIFFFFLKTPKKCDYYNNINPPTPTAIFILYIIIINISSFDYYYT